MQEDITFNKIFRFIKNKDRVIDVCERLELKENELFGIIELLKIEGYDVDIYEQDGELLISKRGNCKILKKVKTPLDELEHVSLGILSDTHCGSKLEQPSLVKKFYELGREKGVEAFLHSGDMVDGYYVPKRPAQIYDLHAIGFTQQGKNVVLNYPRVLNDRSEVIPTYFIGGSHDFTHMINGGADMGEYIDERREDMHFLGYNQATYKAGSSKNILIKMQHPGGGVSKAHSYKPQEAINKIESGDKPKILLQGHYHKSYYMFYRNVHTFLVPCMCDQSQFMKMNDIPNIVGGYFLDLYVSKKGEIQFLDFEEVRYGKSDINPEDYRNCRQLILKK